MILRNDDKNFIELWDKEVNKHYFSPFYSTAKQDYFNQRPRDQKNFVKNVSFLILKEGNVIAGFCGSLIRNEKKVDITAGEVPCISFFNNSEMTKVYKKEYIGEIEDIISKASGEFHVRENFTDKLTILSKYLLSEGATSLPRFFMNIDLLESEEKLKQHLWRSNKNNINWGLKKFETEIVTNDKIKWETIDDFRKLHIQVSGRKTRSIRTWEKQYEMVQKKEAFLALGFLNKRLVAAGFFLNSKSNCYYSVSASLRELFEKPVFHSLMWKAILHSKSIGCRTFEVGEQVFKNQSFRSVPTKKELSISEFKAGFGGNLTCCLDIIYK